MVRHWTDETDAEAVSFFDSLPEAEIRRRQDLCSQQQGRAYEMAAAGRDMTDTQADLQRMSDALAASMLRRLEAGTAGRRRAGRARSTRSL
jgi:hypothetical protein